MTSDVEIDGTGISNLRRELKKWEASFAAANGGRKPAREDIKNDATISAKYREYDRLAGRTTKAESTARKRAKHRPVAEPSRVLKARSSNAITATPRKSSKDGKMPSAPGVPIVQEEEPTPACVRFALGPTPQKDGAVLGIFDILPIATPSKAGNIPTFTSGPIVCATPSKAALRTSTDLKLSKTPQSSSKRFYLDAFAGTPLKRKREDNDRTPSTAKRQYATPSFLRRNVPLARIDDDGGEAAFASPPFKKLGFVRSLSSIIHGLKKQEEQRMDDEWDVMNEIEAEERGEVSQPKIPKVLVEDSQAVEMPFGPDQGPESSDEDEAGPGALDANGKPRKVWKKKGLKRQTRRVIMRPVTHNPRKAADAAPLDSEESEEDDVAETQLQGTSIVRSERQFSDDEDRVSDDGAGASDRKHESQKSHRELVEQKSKNRKKAKEKKQFKQAASDGESTGKKPKKVSAQAHANFRKLKIKNKNSKANGRGRKFGRR